MNEKLLEVRAMAQEKIASGAEPPWSWYQYMKLIETVDAIVAGAAQITTANSPQLANPAGAHLRLVAAIGPQDGVQRLPAGLPVQMPT